MSHLKARVFLTWGAIVSALGWTSVLLGQMDGDARPASALWWLGLSALWFVAGGVWGLLGQEIMSLCLQRNAAFEALEQLQEDGASRGGLRSRILRWAQAPNAYAAPLFGLDRFGNKIGRDV